MYTILMKNIELKNEFEFQLLQYILLTSKDKSIHHIFERLSSFMKMFQTIKNV